MDTRVTNWMDRSCGRWTSYRRYIYTKFNKQIKYETTLICDKRSDNSWGSQWCSKDENGEYFSEGDMELFITPDNKCERSRGYMSEEPDTSDISVIDDDCLVWETSYNGMTFREEIRLCENDTVRLRQTYGKKLSDGTVFLVGQYYEKRSGGNENVPEVTDSVRESEVHT
jgi:hypothetical protein